MALQPRQPAPMRVSRIADAVAGLERSGGARQPVGLRRPPPATQGWFSAVLSALLSLLGRRPATPPAFRGFAAPVTQALLRLREGNARYAANAITQRDFSVGRVARAEAQAPFASILSCSDSRLAPELVFDQGPGALFVVRVAGNFVDREGLATLEFGAAMLNVPLIMVLGHSDCGAVNATINAMTTGEVLPGQLPNLVNALRPAVEAAQARRPANLAAEATRENVLRNVSFLETANPILAPRVASGDLAVVGAIYDIATGTVALLT